MDGLSSGIQEARKAERQILANATGQRQVLARAYPAERSKPGNPPLCGGAAGLIRGLFARVGVDEVQRGKGETGAAVRIAGGVAVNPRR